jgi:hypothetical protein
LVIEEGVMIGNEWTQGIDRLKEENATLLKANSDLLADLLRERNKGEQIRRGMVTILDMMSIERGKG